MIQNKVDYIDEAHRQLHNHLNYEKLNSDRNPTIVKTVKKILLFVQERDLLDTDVIKYLMPKNPRTPVFHLLPKIHKIGNPGRPIVSQISSATEKLSEFVDVYLKPLATSTDSYIRDTSDFLSKLKDIPHLPPGTFICTADVSSLYTSIPHADGIRAAKLALDNRDNLKPPTWIILRMIAIILNNNCFRFGSDYYLQKQGTAMGTKMAPNYAIVFMDSYPLFQKFH